PLRRRAAGRVSRGFRRRTARTSWERRSMLHREQGALARRRRPRPPRPDVAASWCRSSIPSPPSRTPLHAPIGRCPRDFGCSEGGGEGPSWTTVDHDDPDFGNGVATLDEARLGAGPHGLLSKPRRRPRPDGAWAWRRPIDLIAEW